MMCFLKMYTNLLLLWILVILQCLFGSSMASPIVSTAESRLPMSLSTVVSDLEAEGLTEVSTACLITSKSVSLKERMILLKEVLGDVEEGAEEWKAVGTTAGLALAQPTSYQETASTALVCGGTILYYPDTTDLQRGEGLFDTLAPAMEKILATAKRNGEESTATLYVLVVDGDESDVKARLEQAAESVLQNLIIDDHDGTSTNPITLNDVFAKVMYIAPSQVSTVIEHKKSPTDIAASVAEIWATSTSDSWLSTSQQVTPVEELTSANLAAARKLGPVVRTQLEDSIAQVKQACTNPDGTTKLVVDFGQLCDATIKAMTTTTSTDNKYTNSPVGKQIRTNLRIELESSLNDMFAEQLDLLQLASFEEFKRNLSKLIVTPTLQKDMEETASKSITAFTKAAKKLIPKTITTNTLSSWNISNYSIQYKNKLNEYVKQRILSAKSKGQYKPIPRKGVTVGLHWLLPKPFGNDYRQEPWMEHATDNMVYIPNLDSKVQDVSPEDVAIGDWKDKIVPNPAGNDMLYMQ